GHCAPGVGCCGPRINTPVRLTLTTSASERASFAYAPATATRSDLGRRVTVVCGAYLSRALLHGRGARLLEAIPRGPAVCGSSRIRVHARSVWLQSDWRLVL